MVELSYGGGDAIKSWASTQQTIALSSGEAELYALTKATSQSMGILQMLRDFGIEGDAQVYSDSTAAIGIVSRHGLGRTRHIKVQYLWIQEKILNGEVDVKKVDGKENIADLFNKYLKRDDIYRLLAAMGMWLESGRSDIGLKISSINSVKDFRYVEDATVDVWKDLRGNGSPCGNRYLQNCCQFVPRIFALNSTVAKNQQNEICSTVRWVRSHGKERNKLFFPMGLKNGPSRITHVPNFGVTFIEAGSDDEARVIVDQWKGRDYDIQDGPQFKGWTAFISYVPRSLDEADLI